MSGQLILVATPIGNLGDISERMKQVLEQADLIACEDSRHSGRLVKHMGITSPKYIVVNDHTERDACNGIVEAIMGGKTIALITDAGTPGISDPGSVVVQAVIAAGLSVTAVPGPAALIMALIISGIPTTRFVFEGFLPRSGRDRAERLADIASEMRTVIFYEAPHRIARTLNDLAVACQPDRLIAVTRELTKMHEEVWRGSVSEAALHFATVEAMGEFVVVLAAAEAPLPADEDLIKEALVHEFSSGLSTRDAVDAVVKKTNAPKRVVYALALLLNNKEITNGK
ncbi:MAG: 16S rRNA (cytidine(1402)-2'-O)-methyltransferase [Ilumatobacteraceae bacterium]|jgi:16S rRNA (cytidine1402-2'-O)-methyltransferase|nr:16S rRNA (cytidine(1402)-2'-O)-methyltransferase [Ilumatobacteraceae bacterium]MDP4702058.1 16S rRNA (cytidine(1402)-2'-O)-methyltransferase [Ilumatobacteraceae bacterium]MDP5109351.1 16S rRNA (cytidine(1402)-2'-O)-methyltransferase [Ilumatobacteraceae bacterium]